MFHALFVYVEDHLVAVLVALFLFFYIRSIARPHLLFSPHTRFPRELFALPSLRALYIPPIWCFNGHLQTIVMANRHEKASVAYVREWVNTEDGGVVAMDAAQPQDGAAGDLVMLFHGLTGGSGEPYIRSLVVLLLQSGFRVIVHNFRGCADSPLLNWITYSASTTTDFKRSLLMYRPTYAIGFSLGANVLTKTVGELGPLCIPFLRGVVALSNPFDCLRSSRALNESFLGRLYSTKLATNLTRFVKRHEHALVGSPHVDLSRGLRSRSVREFDELLTRRNFGFQTVDEYYSEASSSRLVENIAVPCIFINAADDAISPESSIPLAACHNNPNILVITTKVGGHVAWANGFLGISRASWADRVVVDILKTLHQFPPAPLPPQSQQTQEPPQTPSS